MTTRPSDRSPDTFEPSAMHTGNGWLDTEIEATSTNGTRALLLYEAALLAEQSGNATDAAKLHLQAVNTDPHLAEPVERLLAVFEQRHSPKNIGRVVERLSQLASTVEEQERAALERAAFAMIEQHDAQTARKILLDVVDAAPSSSSVWNFLNLVAEQTRDLDLLQRAIKARASLSNNSTWSGLLLVELAELRHKIGGFEEALEALDQVIEAAGPVTFNALEMLERLSFSQQQHEILSRALVSRASLLDRATHDSSIGDALGVPRWRRTEQHVADAFLRAAIARQRAGNTGESAILLERGLALLPTDPVIEHVALLCAEERKDFDLAVSLAKNIASRTSNDTAGSAWLRVAFSELARGARDSAMRATAAGLVAAPQAIALRALEFHVLETSDDPAAFTSAIESCAEVLTSDVAKGRYYLTAAELWARRTKDSTSARAALAQAALFGTEPRVVNRVARLLATELNDPNWYDESTRRLATSTSNLEEQCELWLELVRTRLKQDSPERFASALAGLAACQQGTWLARTFEAYRLPDPSAAKGPETRASANSLVPEPVRTLAAPDEPLLRLATLAPDACFSRAYSINSVVRQLRQGDRSSAIQKLRNLASNDASDALIILALSNLHMAEGSRGAATEILGSGANTITHEYLAGIVAIKAAFLAAETGDVLQCRQALDCARSRVPEAAAVTEAWLIRRMQPNDVLARRQLLDSVVQRHSHDRLMLEKFALELQTRNLAAAGLALEEVVPNESAIGIAVAFAKVLLDSATNLEAIDTLVSLVPSFDPVAAALRSRYALANYHPESSEYLDATQRWARVDSTIASSLEYLSAARAAGRLEFEFDAWDVLSQRTEGTKQFQVDLARSRACLFGNTTAPQLLQSRTVEGRIFNLEASRPGCDPRRRCHSLREFVPMLDESDRGIGEVLIGYNCLAAGLTEEALEQFKSTVGKLPNNPAAWEGLRLAAQICHDSQWIAESCEALASVYNDSTVAAQLFEQAARIWLDELHDESRGERALALAVSRDVQLFSAFDRLFRRVRDRNDGPRLIELIDSRLEVSDDADELVKLHWERARVLRGIGDRDAALSALENVTLLEPDHIGALALAAEISIATGRFAEAAKYLDRLARLESAPNKQRLMSGTAAADLYDSKLNLPELAVSVLLVLDSAELGTLAVRERLARSAARCENWDLAGETLLGLAETRESSQGRVEAARLALSIYRDKLSSPEQALSAVQRLLSELPDDGEAIDCVIEQSFSPEHNRELCELARDALRSRLLEQPVDAESIDRLAQIAAILDDAPLRQVALGALVCIESGAPSIVEELAVLASRVARLPSIALDENCLLDLVEAGDGGPLAELFVHLAPYFAEALGPSLSVLGVTKKQRVDPRSGLPVRNEIAAWAGALGIGEFDVYVGGIDPNNVVGIPSEIPALVIGSALNAPLIPQHRQLVARELYAIRRGTSLLRHRTGAEIAALVVAVCRLAEVKIEAPAYALVEEFSRLLNSVLPRKIRKSLPTLCAPLVTSVVDPLDWHAAATSSMDRMAALGAGDISLVVGPGNIHGETEAMGSLRERQERLLRFAFSAQYLSLRDRLGIRVK